MTYVFANNPESTLAIAANPGDTTLSLPTGEGARFPALGAGQNFPVTVEDGAGMEIMLCTSRTGDVLTVTRAQEGTAALTFGPGAIVQARITKAALDSFIQRGGDTMQGLLTLTAVGTQAVLAPSAGGSRMDMKAAAGSTNQIQMYQGVDLRWNLFSDATNADLIINRFPNTGGSSPALVINRASGAATFETGITVQSVTSQTFIVADNTTSGGAYLAAAAPAGQTAEMVLRNGLSRRWSIGKNADGEIGGNGGADFVVGRYTDAGSLIDNPLKITRSSGYVTVANTLGANRVEVNTYVTTPGAIMNDTAGLGFSVNGYQTVAGPTYVCYFGSANPNLGSNVSLQAVHQSGVFAACRVAVQGQVFDFRGDGQAYKAVAGDWASISDERIKNLKRPYTLGLSFVLALDPWVYTLKEELGRGDTHEYVSATAQNVEAAGDEGFMVKSQRLLEGALDIPDCRILDTSAMQWAIVNALKEMNAKFEALSAEFEAYKVAHP